MAVPGAVMDCVVVVDEKDRDELHAMSFVERYDPGLSGQIRTPVDQLSKMPIDIARRAFFSHKTNTVRTEKNIRGGQTTSFDSCLLTSYIYFIHIPCY